MVLKMMLNGAHVFVCCSTTDLPAPAPLGLGTFTQTSGSRTLTFLTFLMNTHSEVEGIFLSLDSTREKAIWVLDFLKAKPGHCRSAWPHLPSTQDHAPMVCPVSASSQMADPGDGVLLAAVSIFTYSVVCLSKRAAF